MLLVCDPRTPEDRDEGGEALVGVHRRGELPKVLQKELSRRRGVELVVDAHGCPIPAKDRAGAEAWVLGVSDHGDNPVYEDLLLSGQGSRHLVGKLGHGRTS